MHSKVLLSVTNGGRIRALKYNDTSPNTISGNITSLALWKDTAEEWAAHLQVCYILGGRERGMFADTSEYSF